MAGDEFQDPLVTTRPGVGSGHLSERVQDGDLTYFQGGAERPQRPLAHFLAARAYLVGPPTAVGLLETVGMNLGLYSRREGDFVIKPWVGHRPVKSFDLLGRVL